VTYEIKLPNGTTQVVEASSAAQIPEGATIDTTEGSITLTTELPSGKTQSAQFSGGEFTVVQKPSEKGLVELRLAGPVPVCPAGGVNVRHKRKGVIRRLWGRDRNGRYRTRGANGAATVRGTRWLTEDRCDGTLTKVVEGAVDVRDFTLRKTVRVNAGEKYLAPVKRPSKRRR
jgi:hypothetical protein